MVCSISVTFVPPAVIRTLTKVERICRSIRATCRPLSESEAEAIVSRSTNFPGISSPPSLLGSAGAPRISTEKLAVPDTRPMMASKPWERRGLEVIVPEGLRSRTTPRSMGIRSAFWREATAVESVPTLIAISGQGGG